MPVCSTMLRLMIVSQIEHVLGYKQLKECIFGTLCVRFHFRLRFVRRQDQKSLAEQIPVTNCNLAEFLYDLFSSRLFCQPQEIL